MIVIADSEGPDQTARMRRLIWDFAIRICTRSHFHIAWPTKYYESQHALYFFQKLNLVMPLVNLVILLDWWNVIINAKFLVPFMSNLVISSFIVVTGVLYLSHLWFNWWLGWYEISLDLVGLEINGAVNTVKVMSSLSVYLIIHFKGSPISD